MREDWMEIPLRQACCIHDNLRKPINSKERNARIEGKAPDQLFPYYGATGQVGFIDDYLTDGEYVLIGEDGAPFLDSRKSVAYLISGKTWVNNHAHVLKSHFNDRFLLYYLNQFNYYGYVSGTTRLKLTQGSLKTIPVRLAPLPEQRAIVAKIEQLFSELDNGIANLQTARKKLDIYRQAVLKKAFEGELTKTWRQQQVNLPSADELLEQIKAERQRHYDQQLADWQAAVEAWEQNGKSGKRPRKPKRLKSVKKLGKNELSGLPVLPKRWLWTRIYQVGDVQLGRQRAPKHHTGDQMRPYLRVANVFENRIDISDVMEMNFTDEEYELYRLSYGDILLNEGQSPELVGRPAIYREEVPGACFTNTLVRFRTAASMSNNYAFYLFLTYLKTGRFQKIASITTNIAHLGAGRFAELEFPLPPLAEQNQIVQEIESRLSVCDKLAEAIDTSLQQAEALRQSILKKAFEGRLLTESELAACRKEPDWEPAEKLMERLDKEESKR